MRKLRPHHLILGFWLVLAAAFGLSGVVSTITQQHDDSPVSREVFGNIPGAWKLAALHVHGRHPRVDRRRSSATGSATGSGAGPTTAGPPRKNAKRRFGDFRAGVYMQTLLRDPAAGIMHSLIYFSFLVLLRVTTVLEINHQVPESWKFLHGDVYQAYAVGRRRRRRHAARRRGVGDRPPLRAAALPHPHQVQARARGHPRHVPRCSASRASWPRPTASPSPSRPDFEQFSFVGYPLQPARWTAPATSPAGTRSGGSPTSPASSPSCVLLPVTMLRHMFTSPAEHVPEGQGRAPRAR